MSCPGRRGERRPGRRRVTDPGPRPLRISVRPILFRRRDTWSYVRSVPPGQRVCRSSVDLQRIAPPNPCGRRNEKKMTGSRSAPEGPAPSLAGPDAHPGAGDTGAGRRAGSGSQGRVRPAPLHAVAASVDGRRYCAIWPTPSMNSNASGTWSADMHVHRVCAGSMMSANRMCACRAVGLLADHSPPSRPLVRGGSRPVRVSFKRGRGCVLSAATRGQVSPLRLGERAAGAIRVETASRWHGPPRKRPMEALGGRPAEAFTPPGRRAGTRRHGPIRRCSGRPAGRINNMRRAVRASAVSVAGRCRTGPAREDRTRPATGGAQVRCPGSVRRQWPVPVVSSTTYSARQYRQVRS